MSPQTWITIITAVISTGTTVFLAYITWRYVRLTREYVGLTNEILKATNKPEVILFLHDNGAVIYLCIENIGTGYASDIEFTGNLSFRPTFPRAQPLKETEPFKSGINFLGAGHKINTFLCDDADVRDIGKRSFKILVSYKDSAGKTFKQLFPFDLGNWGNTSQFITPYTDDVSNAIEKVAGLLEQMTNRWSGRDRMNNVARSILRKDDPEVTALQRIADALDRIAPSE